MLHFYGSPRSSSGRTHWMLEELGIPYEYHRVNLRDPATKTPAFLAASPGGRVPAIDDGGFRLFESVAINAYLADKYRPEWLGTTIEERALVNQWTCFAMTNLQPEVLELMYHTGILPEAERIPSVAESSKKAAAALVAELDRALAGKEFVACDRFTVADVNLGSVLTIAAFLGLLGDGAPHVAAYAARLRARPALERAAKGA